MKQTTLTQTFCAALLALTILPAVAQEATDTGTRGGGESVDVRGRPVLRDLVDNTSCDWATGRDMMAAQPRVNQILTALEGVHWYFGFQLRWEMESLHYCRTQNLVRVSTSDAGGLTIYAEAGDTEQAAIRLNRSVYLNNTIYSRMDATSQAFLQIHEALHSFIPMNSELRNGQLRSTVAALLRLESGAITGDQLLYQMSRNQVNTPPSVLYLSPDNQRAFASILRGAGDSLQRQVDASRLSNDVLTEATRTSSLYAADALRLTEVAAEFVPSFSVMDPSTLQSWLPRLTRPQLEELLGAAIRNGAIDRVNALLNTGLVNRSGGLPLIALANHKYDVLRALLARPDVGINARDADGFTLLHRLAVYGVDYYNHSQPADLLDALLARRDLRINAALPIAASRSAERLLAAEEWASANEGATALMLAAGLSDISIAQKLLADRRSNLNAQDANGNTVLHRLVLRKYDPILIRNLLTSGRIDANIANNRGLTALMLAVSPHLGEEDTDDDTDYESLYAQSQYYDRDGFHNESRYMILATFAGPIGRSHGVNVFATVTPRRRTPYGRSFAERYEGQNVLTLAYRTTNVVSRGGDIACNNYFTNNYSLEHVDTPDDRPSIGTTLFRSLPLSYRRRLIALRDIQGRDAVARAHWVVNTCKRDFGYTYDSARGGGWPALFELLERSSH